MTDKNYGVSPELLEQLSEAEKVVADIRKQINEQACKNAGIKPGEIVRNKFTGLTYKINHFNANAYRGRVEISIVAHRYYKSGIREGRTARSVSFVSFSDLEKVEQDVAN